MAEKITPKEKTPDIFALMRADPFPPPRAFTDADQALMDGEGAGFFLLCMIWSDCFVLPAVFAGKRRARGDPAAAPRDHECGCDVLNNSFQPVCEKRRPDCKFETPPGPPTCYRGGVPFAPPKPVWPRRRYALFQARTAFLAYADAAPSGRRAMERQVRRALSAPRATAFVAGLIEHTQTAGDADAP